MLYFVTIGLPCLYFPKCFFFKCLNDFLLCFYNAARPYLVSPVWKLKASFIRRLFWPPKKGRWNPGIAGFQVTSR